MATKESTAPQTKGTNEEEIIKEPNVDNGSVVIPGDSAAPSLVGVPALQEPGPLRLSKLVKVRQFLYNRTNGQILGREKMSWLELLVFYVLYYFFVFTFFVLWVIIVIQVYGNYKPAITTGTLTEPVILSGATGLTFFPIAPSAVHAPSIADRKGSETIYYDINSPESSQIYADRLDITVKASNYSFQNNGLCTQAAGYGYRDGHPCFLIRFNHVFNWVPMSLERLEAYVKETYRTDHPTYLATIRYLAALQNIILAGGTTYQEFMKNNVGIECTSDSSRAEEGSVGTVVYFPAPGIPVAKFMEGIQLQNAQIGNRDKSRRWDWTPYIFVQLQDPARNRLLHVICKAYEQNMDLYFARQGIGAVHFTVYIVDNQLTDSTYLHLH